MKKMTESVLEQISQMVGMDRRERMEYLRFTAAARQSMSQNR